MTSVEVILLSQSKKYIALNLNKKRKPKAKAKQNLFSTMANINMKMLQQHMNFMSSMLTWMVTAYKIHAFLL